ncbi:hypothetical protein PIROE2DRAFT_13904, partial [Piromyces sp. E2]
IGKKEFNNNTINSSNFNKNDIKFVESHYANNYRLFKKDNEKEEGFSNEQEEFEDVSDENNAYDEHFFGGCQLDDLLEEQDYVRNVNSLQIKEYKNLDEFYSELNTYKKNTDMILIKFENQYTYTILFSGFESLSDKLNVNDIDEFGDFSDTIVFYMSDIRYYCIIQSIIDKMLIRLSNPSLNLDINYNSRIMDINERREKIYLYGHEIYFVFFSIFYFL